MTQIGFGGIFNVFSQNRCATQERSKGEKTTSSSYSRLPSDACFPFQIIMSLQMFATINTSFACAGGAVASKDKKVETDEIAEVVDEATAALKELNASGSVSKSVADTQLAAARNVTGDYFELPQFIKSCTQELCYSVLQVSLVHIHYLVI